MLFLRFIILFISVATATHFLIGFRYNEYYRYEGVVKMIKIIQKVTQLVFLLFFIYLIFIGKIQLWMLLFLVGLVTSALFSRYYCGWICPINTGMRMISTFKEKRNLNTK